MAQKPLRGINFPGLEDTYIVPKADDTLSATSTNPVQNKAVYAGVNSLAVGIQTLHGMIPTDSHINDLIDAYLSEALGGDY